MGHEQDVIAYDHILLGADRKAFKSVCKDTYSSHSFRMSVESGAVILAMVNALILPNLANAAIVRCEIVPLAGEPLIPPGPDLTEEVLQCNDQTFSRSTTAALGVGTVLECAPAEDRRLWITCSNNQTYLPFDNRTLFEQAKARSEEAERSAKFRSETERFEQEAHEREAFQQFQACVARLAKGWFESDASFEKRLRETCP